MKIMHSYEPNYVTFAEYADVNRSRGYTLAGVVIRVHTLIYTCVKLYLYHYIYA